MIWYLKKTPAPLAPPPFVPPTPAAPGEDLTMAKGILYLTVSEQVYTGETGMVFCPVKLAGIAVMRCGDYQKEQGCGAGCAQRATERQIQKARAEAEMGHARSYELATPSPICPECGRQKAPYSLRCRKCRDVDRGSYRPWRRRRLEAVK